MHLVREILEGLEDDTEGALINLTGRTIGSWRRFRDCQIRTGVPQMDQHDVPQPAGGGAGKRKAFGTFRD